MRRKSPSGQGRTGTRARSMARGEEGRHQDHLDHLEERVAHHLPQVLPRPGGSVSTSAAAWQWARPRSSAATVERGGQPGQQGAGEAEDRADHLPPPHHQDLGHFGLCFCFFLLFVWRHKPQTNLVSFQFFKPHTGPTCLKSYYILLMTG